MILRRLELGNIRSYRDESIDFPLGRTLFEGDIGSGKSTILMAIEFAFFGLGSAKASSLLKVGESEGRVSLIFEVGGNEYRIDRTLARKGEAVQQGGGKITGPNGEEDLSASELKERVLEILNFHEPTDPKSRSLIYQYAIYTPQEEIRQIISLRPDLRLQILRRAFRVEDYKLAMENSKQLLDTIREKALEFQATTKDLQELKRQLSDLDGKMELEIASLRGLEGERKEKASRFAELEKRETALQGTKVKLAEARSELAHLQKAITDGRRQLEEAERDGKELERIVADLRERSRQDMRAPTSMTQAELKTEIKALQEQRAAHIKAEAQVQLKLGQFESVLKNGMCPVCERTAGADEFGEKISHLKEERATKSNHLEQLTAKLDEVEKVLERRRSYDVAVDKAKEILANLTNQERRLERTIARIREIQTSLEAAQLLVPELRSRVERFDEEAKGLDELQRDVETARRELELVERRIAVSNSNLKNWDEAAKPLRGRIQSKEKERSSAELLREREIWLKEYFMPTLDDIERHVMIAINQEFDSNFQRWFSVLVEDVDKEARVDEDFTPIVDQDGYEQDIEFLSGGERTSVALAYRLALSQMVQKVAMDGAWNPLILDEPTDGFSKEQLGKMREILDEIDNPQVIMVSHERELESFADQIYRVEKVRGESKVLR